jgi:hypothetical protein
MSRTIRLRVTHPTKPEGPIEGFTLLWAFYVRGFKPEVHCQECFVGERASNFHSRNHRSGVDIDFDQMDAFPFVYICGVADGPHAERWHTNLHFPLRYEAGAHAETTTHNGYRFVAEDAVQMPIPDLCEGWRGLPREHERCKNFRFGVEYFGAQGFGLRDGR